MSLVLHYYCIFVSQQINDDDGPTLWNSLPLTVRDLSLTLTQFRSLLKTVLYCRASETLP